MPRTTTSCGVVIKMVGQVPMLGAACVVCTASIAPKLDESGLSPTKVGK